jgi:hypothetical protein
MQDKDFELIIITDQKNSLSILETVKETNIDFKIGGERGFAPISPDVAIQYLITVASLLPVIYELSKKVWKKKGYIAFETRHRLAREMLAEFAPLQELKAEDRPDFSYYIFKTKKGERFWEYNKGEIRHGAA